MKKTSGQSLLEMVVAIAVVLIVIVALVAVTTVSVRNAGFSRNQALATKYAQEGIEEARKLRDSQKEDVFFVDGSCSTTKTIGIFSFQRTCTLAGDKTMTVTVVVSWTDAKGTHKSELKTYLTNWK